MANTLTLSSYITRTQAKLDDYSYNGSVLTAFANDVNREICNSAEWPFMQTTFVGTLTIGTNSYDISDTAATLQQIINFELTSPNASAIFPKYMPFQEFDQRYPDPTQYTNSQPTIWTRFGDNLIFGPAAPDQTYTMQMRYLKAPTTLVNSTDTLDVPDDFSELVVLGMYARALEQLDQPDYAVGQYARFNVMLNQMRDRYLKIQSGTPMVMQTSRGLKQDIYRDNF